MSSRTLLRGLACVITAAVLASPTQAQDKFTLALNWIPHALHFGIYLAQERGWYRDAGIDLTIQRGFGSTDTVKRVATGSADFGMADAASVMVGRANGINTKLVAMLMERPADAIYFVKGGDIKSVKDLEGNTMGAAAGETSLNLLPVFAKSAGIDSKKINIVTMSSPNKIPSLVQRRVDTIVTFTNEEPMIRNAAKSANAEIGRFLFADYGVDYYSIGFIVSDKMFQSKPQAIEKFLEATLRGYAEAFRDPAAGLDAFIKNNPESSRDLMQQQWEALQYNIKTPTALAKGLGFIDEDKMSKTLQLMREFQNVKADVKPSEVYSIDELPRVDVNP